MSQRPRPGADDIGPDPTKVNFFQLQAATSDPAATSAYVLAHLPVPHSGQLLAMQHHSPYSPSAKHRTKRIFEVHNSPSHEHIISPRPQPGLDPARFSENSAHRSAPFATAHTARESGHDEPLVSTGRSLTPTRLRGTPSPSRSRGYSQINSVHDDSPFSQTGKLGTAGTQQRTLRRISPARPPRHPITGDGVELNTRRRMAPGKSKASNVKPTDPVSHDHSAPIVSDLISAETNRPITRKKTHAWPIHQQGNEVTQNRVLSSATEDAGAELTPPCASPGRAEPKPKPLMKLVRHRILPHIPVTIFA